MEKLKKAKRIRIIKIEICVGIVLVILVMMYKFYLADSIALRKEANSIKAIGCMVAINHHKKIDSQDSSNMEFEIQTGYIDNNKLITSLDDTNKFKIYPTFIFAKSAKELNAAKHTCLGEDGSRIETIPDGISPHDYNFFNEHNVAVFIYDDKTISHNIKIHDVIKEDDTATINVSDYMGFFKGSYIPEIIFTYIIFDKSINNVNFNAYVDY